VVKALGYKSEGSGFKIQIGNFSIYTYLICIMHNVELRDLYSSSTIIRIMKSRRMGWAGHVARMGEKRNACRSLLGKPEVKRH
jgi:hypothetical protein